MKILIDRQSVRGVPASEGEGEGEGVGSHTKNGKTRSGELRKIRAHGAREESKVRVRVRVG
jgi:hypothetical protein